MLDKGRKAARSSPHDLVVVACAGIADGAGLALLLLEVRAPHQVVVRVAERLMALPAQREQHEVVSRPFEPQAHGECSVHKPHLLGADVPRPPAQAQLVDGAQLLQEGDRALPEPGRRGHGYVHGEVRLGLAGYGGDDDSFAAPVARIVLHDEDGTRASLLASQNGVEESEKHIAPARMVVHEAPPSFRYVTAAESRGRPTRGRLKRRFRGSRSPTRPLMAWRALDLARAGGYGAVKVPSRDFLPHRDGQLGGRNGTPHGEKH